MERVGGGANLHYPQHILGQDSKTDWSSPTAGWSKDLEDSLPEACVAWTLSHWRAWKRQMMYLVHDSSLNGTPRDVAFEPYLLLSEEALDLHRSSHSRSIVIA